MSSGIIIVGAGLSGLSAAVTCAGAGMKVLLFSNAASERAASVMAEGGINGALDTMGEGDTVKLHYEETLKSGRYIADKEAVSDLTEAAPDIITWLSSLGVPFNRENGRIVQRFFGGQSKRRAAYVRSGTGKALMTALIDEARRFEVMGRIERFLPWQYEDLITDETGGRCLGVKMYSVCHNEHKKFYGPVIMCSGGLGGFFSGITTGSTLNDGSAAASLFSRGVRFSNLEMMQYHPTTVKIAGKRLLVTEAARGEGGRLYVTRKNTQYYFMEDRYPERGNLMPRDVVSREIARVHDEQISLGEDEWVYLDLTRLPAEVIEKNLSELKSEMVRYLGIDPATTPIPVSPGIHYFMGGIDCDRLHRTNISGLYAAGECTSLYHGANRLGGNSLLGAIYGGRRAAKTVALEYDGTLYENVKEKTTSDSDMTAENDSEFAAALSDILCDGLSIIRSSDGLLNAISRLEELCATAPQNSVSYKRAIFGEAMLRSALLRQESRGAHYRSDYPKENETLAKRTVASCEDGVLSVGYADDNGNEAAL